MSTNYNNPDEKKREVSVRDVTPYLINLDLVLFGYKLDWSLMNDKDRMFQVVDLSTEFVLNSFKTYTEVLNYVRENDYVLKIMDLNGEFIEEGE